MEHNRDAILGLLSIQPRSLVEMHFFEMLGRVSIVVQDESSIPPRDVNRNANREFGWGLEVFTAQAYARHLREGFAALTSINRIDAKLANLLVANGFMTLDDLSIIDPVDLARLGGFDLSTADDIISEVDIRCLEDDK